MVKVELFGILGKKFGNLFKFNCRSIKEILQAIQANRKSFRAFCFASEKKSAFFSVLLNGKRISSLDWDKKINFGDVVSLVPIIAGASFKKILGGLLVVVGVIIGVLAGWTGIGAMIAVSLVTTGLTLLLTPTPKVDAQRQETNAGLNSYLFGGRLNNAKQGGPVPLGYGQLKIGSVVISANIEPQRISLDRATFGYVSFTAMSKQNGFADNNSTAVGLGLPSNTKVVKDFSFVGGGGRMGIIRLPTFTIYLKSANTASGYEKFGNPEDHATSAFKIYQKDESGNFVLFAEQRCKDTYILQYKGEN